MSFAKTLSRDEMRNVKAGIIQPGGGGGNCRIYNGSSWVDKCYSVESAQSFYGFDEITGYCCASCGSGNFSNADPC